MSNEQDPSKPGQQQAAANGADDDSRPVTMADLKALLGAHAAETSKTVNAAVTSHTRRLAKDWEGRLAALAPKPAEGDGGVEGEGDEPGKAAAAKPGKAAEGAPPSAEAQRIADLEKRLAKQERDIKVANETAAKERRQRIEEAGVASLRSAFTGKVLPGTEDDVVTLLRARKQVAIDDAGAVRLRLGVKDEPDEGHDIEEGVALFLKTDRAKHFLPAPNSGAAGGKKPPIVPPARTPALRPSASPITVFEQSTGKSIDDLI